MTRAFNFGVKLAVSPVMADQSGAVNQPVPTNGAQHGNVNLHLAQGKDYAQNAKAHYFRGLNGDDSPADGAMRNADAQQTPPNRLSANMSIKTPTVGQPFLPQTAMPPATKAPVLGKAGSLLEFGAKVAQVTGMTYDENNSNVKKLKRQYPTTWRKVMAESQGLSDDSQAKPVGSKCAQSTCSPCDMPNSPTNKKHITSASPAVTDASEHSEEIGKPEVVETEHSEAKAKQPEEGIKAAKLGLWDRIRAKKERGGTAAKPGDKDYPDSKSWKKVTAISKKSAAQLGTKLAAEPSRWAFDGQGPGDAQAREAIYNAIKGFGDKLPKPSSSYAYGPGGGGASAPDLSGVNPAAYGAAPSHGPMGLASSGPSLGRRNPNSTAIDEMFQASRGMLPKMKSSPNPRYASENVDAGVPGAVEAFKAQQAAKVPTPNMSSKAPAAAMSRGGYGKSPETPKVDSDSSGPQFSATAAPKSRPQLVNQLRAMNNMPAVPDARSFNEFQTNLNKSVAELRARARANGQAIPSIEAGAEAVPSNPKKPSTSWAKMKPVESSLSRGEDPFGDKPAPGMLSQAMKWMGKNPGYTAAGGLGALGLGGALYYATRPKKKKKEEEEEVKSAAGISKFINGLMKTPAQAGQSAMMSARKGANGLSRPPAGMLPTPDYSGKYNRMLGNLRDPHIGGSSRDDLAVWAQNHADAMVPKYTPRRPALAEVGQTAARNQGLTQAGVLGGAAGLGALSQAGQQAPPPEVKAKPKPVSSSASVSPSSPAPVTPMDMFRRVTGGYSRLPK
jgi:hypothetical protein